MSADEMFEKLGYKKTLRENCIEYCKSIDNLHYTEYYTITFFIPEKWVYMNNPWGNKIEIEELQAINKKVEELRLEQRGEIEYG